MTPSLTIAFITARQYPKFKWFADSLNNQGHAIEGIIAVDLFADLEGRRERWREFLKRDLVHTAPKPCVWQGRQKLTPENWWAASNARNTALALCRTQWICFVDDRCVLMPGFIDAIHRAMNENAGILGSYEKRHYMKVRDGEIVEPGKLDGSDPRSPGGQDHRALNSNSVVMDAPGSWWFGCCAALPLEWGLECNGFLELLDGTSHEDCFFGTMLRSNNHRLIYDKRMKVVQDRTPGETGPDMHRTSKQRFDHDTTDRCHTAIKRFMHLPFAPNNFNLRELRESVLITGEPWPLPPAADAVDWYDGEPVKDFTWPYVVKRQ